MANAYLVDPRANPRANPRTTASVKLDLVTAGSWDALAFDNKLMALRYAHEEMRAERYRARVMDYLFVGHIVQDDQYDLWQGVQFLLWGSLNHGEKWRSTRLWQSHLATLLRAVLSRLFVPLNDSDVEMNLTGPAWTQIAFHIYELIHDDRIVARAGHRSFRRIGFRARSADGLHRIRLALVWEPHNVPGPQTAYVQYVGPQRFRSVEGSGNDVPPAGSAEVGYLTETHRHSDYDPA